MNIYIGQLPFNVNEDELRDLFTEFGQVENMTLAKDRFSGRFKGFAFLEMPDNSQADQAIKALNRSMFKGREIKVNQAEQRKRKSKPRGRRF